MNVQVLITVLVFNQRASTHKTASAYECAAIHKRAGTYKRGTHKSAGTYERDGTYKRAVQVLVKEPVERNFCFSDPN